MNFEQRVIQMRKNNSFISTIVKQVVSLNPGVDEIVILCNCLRILDEKGFAVSRSEVLRTFNRYYNPEFHADKKGYLLWIYKQFHIKAGSITFTSQVRKKTPVPQTWKGKSALNSQENKKTGEIPTETPGQLELKQNGGKTE